MSAPVATSGSSSTHGGAPTSFAATTKAGGLKIVRKGDTFSCPTHGSQTITGGGTALTVESKKAARDGDAISCGATLTGGDANVLVG